MANEEHLKILKQGVLVWNQWRKDNPEIEPDLSGIKIINDPLFNGSSSNDNLIYVNLNGADLSRANLRGADLSEVDINKADLRWADLSGTNLSGKDFTEQNLSEVNFQNANLQKARLIKSRLDGANLTGAYLWETQRAGWSIKGVICEYAYWDEAAENKTEYAPGEFERLFADGTKIKLFYKGGITPLEIVTLPAVIKHFEDSHPGCKIILLTIKPDSGGAVIELALEKDNEQSSEDLGKLFPAVEAQTQQQADEKASEQLKVLAAEIQSEGQQVVQHLRQALQERESNIAHLDGQVKALQWTIREILTNNLGDNYYISGQAGAVGKNARTLDSTLNQTVNAENSSVGTQIQGERNTGDDNSIENE